MKKTITLLTVLACLFFACESSVQDTANQKIDDIKDAATETINDQKEKIDQAIKKEVKPAYGIDVSKFQGDEINMLDSKKDDLTFVICKATEGITYTDPYFKKNWKTIPEKGFIRGAYHFFRSQDDPLLQTQHFLSAIEDLKVTDIAPIVDFESGGIDPSQTVEEVRDNLLAMLEGIKVQSPRNPIIYTDIYTANKYLTDRAFSKFPLWMAYYTQEEEPKIPATWKEKGWTFWQKTSSYQINGEKNDFDVFNSDLEALKSFIEKN